MGEYASYQGLDIKIGTCEDLYYLRADQVGQLDDPRVVTEHLDAYRFRFPFPDEDGTEPGDFENPFRMLRIDGARELLDLISPDSHHAVQFTASAGYVVSLPCPEVGSAGEHPYRVGRNGFRGAIFLVQQRYWEGRLVGVAQCACGARFRLETLDMAERVAVALRAEADAHHDGPGGLGNPWMADQLHEVARRLLAGYETPVRV